MCADFDAMLRHDRRRLGISAEEVREFCVWRNAPMRVLSSQGDLVDSYDPALKEHRTVCFLAFDAQERLHLGPGVPVARALGADHPVPLRVEEVGLVRGWGRPDPARPPPAA